MKKPPFLVLVHSRPTVERVRGDVPPPDLKVVMNPPRPRGSRVTPDEMLLVIKDAIAEVGPPAKIEPPKSSGTRAEPRGRGSGKRRRSGTAEWHLSKKAVNLPITKVIKMTDRQCLNWLVESRFGSWDQVRCAHCGTIGKHYWREKQKRWKCSGCGLTFSITSQTVFADRKLPLQKIVAATVLWSNSSAGQAALELRRHLGTTYNTAFTLQHKLREGAMRAYNVGLLSGDLEIDGAHQSGWDAAKYRGKPFKSESITPETSTEALTEAMVSAGGKPKVKRPPEDRDYVRDPLTGGKYPATRRFFFAIRKRSGIPGRGASATRVAIGRAENPTVVDAIVRRYLAAPESTLNTDKSKAYSVRGKDFLDHRTVDHEKEYSGPHGENNNLSEEANFRMDRAEKGTYLNIKRKYLKDYACEVAFKADTRRMPNGAQAALALNQTLSIGPSEFWEGFTHGRHREVELLVTNPEPAPASGPPKLDPTKPRKRRPPR